MTFVEGVIHKLNGRSIDNGVCGVRLLRGCYGERHHAERWRYVTCKQCLAMKPQRIRLEHVAIAATEPS